MLQDCYWEIWRYKCWGNNSYDQNFLGGVDEANFKQLAAMRIDDFARCESAKGQHEYRFEP
ncbi:MAG: hypothetical protein M1547_02930 [Gammaproteobacteria bacterium]|nr:hypothetical protein [Gammaproteobacteria bacterium]